MRFLITITTRKLDRTKEPGYLRLFLDTHCWREWEKFLAQELSPLIRKKDLEAIKNTLLHYLMHWNNIEPKRINITSVHKKGYIAYSFVITETKGEV